MGIRMSTNSSQLENLRRGYKSYASWYLGAHPDQDGEDLFIDQGRKFATELYNQTAAIAPTPAQIAADVTAQGWKIPRKFPDGRLGRGVPAQWLGVAYKAALKAKEIARKRGRGAKAFNDAQESSFLAQKPTLQVMQAFVIKNRVNAILNLASGWLGAIAELGGSLKERRGRGSIAGYPRQNAKRGGADIHRSPGRSEIVLWNETPGMTEMDAKHGIVAKAVTVRVADMIVYIRRKMDEAAARYLRAG